MGTYAIILLIAGQAFLFQSPTLNDAESCAAQAKALATALVSPELPTIRWKCVRNA